jgi:hypothetical protein
VLFYVVFVCKCVLPPSDNPIAVNKYVICMYKYILHPTGNWPARRLFYRPAVFFRHLRLAFRYHEEKFGTLSTKILLFPFLLTFSKTVRNCSTLNCFGRRVIVSSYLFSKPVTCLVTSCSMANVELLSKGGVLPLAPSQSRRFSIQVNPFPIWSQRPTDSLRVQITDIRPTKFVSP